MTRSIVKSALWVTFSEIIFNLSGFIIHSALGRMLGPGEYGRYSLIITLTTTIIILIGNGIPTAMAKYISEIYETKPRTVALIKNQAILIQALIMSAVTVIFFFSAPLIAGMLSDPTLIPLFRISTLIIPAFAAASFYFSYYTGLHLFNLQAGLKTLRSISRIAFVILLAYFFHTKGAISGYILAPATVFLAAFLFDKFKVSKELKKIPAETEEVSFEWKKLFNYAWQVVVFFLAYELLISIDLYMVKGILKNDDLTGLYNAALTVGRIPYYIFYALTIFMLPMISKTTAANNHDETKRIINQSIRIMLILLVPMILIMAIYAKPILFLFYGAKFVGAAYAMSILEYGVGFLTIFYVLSFALNGAGKTMLAMKISGVGLVIDIVLNYILIKQMGIAGSALATSITSLFIMVAILYFMHKDFGVKIELKTAWKVLISGTGMYLVSLFLSHGKLIFILWSVILFAIYLAILFTLGEIKKDDLAIVKTIIQRKKAAEVEKDLSGNEPEI